MTKAVIFDLDDLMVNSSPLHNKAYELALKDFGIKRFEIPKDLMRKIYGMRIKEIMELFAAHFNMDVDVDELTKRRNDYFLELVKKGIDPMPGLFELIKQIKRWKLKRALATSGVKEYANEVLRQLKLAKFFKTIVTGNDVINPKPAPDTFLLAAERLNEKPCDCVVFEDSTNGLIAAKKAGMLAIGVKNSLHESSQDMSMADIVVSRLDEIKFPLQL